MAGKGVSPGFLFASLLWHQVLEKWNAYKAAGEPVIVVLAGDVLRGAVDAQRPAQGRQAARHALPYRRFGDVESRSDLSVVATEHDALGDRLPDQELTELMGDVGRRLAAEWPQPRGPVTQRVDEASALLQELGAPNEVQRSGNALRIRGFGCLLAAAVHGPLADEAHVADMRRTDFAAAHTL